MYRKRRKKGYELGLYGTYIGYSYMYIYVHDCMWTGIEIDVSGCDIILYGRNCEHLYTYMISK